MKDGKVALVSGANRGIGKEVVRQLAQLDYHVFLGARDPNKGAAAARELGFEKQITPVELDVTNHRWRGNRQRSRSSRAGHFRLRRNRLVRGKDSGHRRNVHGKVFLLRTLANLTVHG